MAMTSRCPRCENSSFEIAEHSPRGSRYKLFFIQCASCGPVVGVMEHTHIGWLIRKLAEKLGFDLD